MVNINNPYQTLGVLPSATDSEIQTAYHKLAKKYHPDLNPDKAKAEEMMKSVNCAYDEIKKMRENPGQTRYTSNGYDYSYANGNDNYAIFSTVENYIRFSQYMEAEAALMAMQDRSARWFYLDAIVKYNLHYYDQARNDIDTAIQMDPYNPEYLQMKLRMSGGIFGYNQTQRKGFSIFKILYGLFKIYIIISVVQLLFSWIFGGQA